MMAKLIQNNKRRKKTNQPKNENKKPVLFLKVER